MKRNVGRGPKIQILKKLNAALNKIVKAIIQDRVPKELRAGWVNSVLLGWIQCCSGQILCWSDQNLLKN